MKHFNYVDCGNNIPLENLDHNLITNEENHLEKNKNYI